MVFRTVGGLLPLFVVLSTATACSADGSSRSQAIAGTQSSSAPQIKITADAKHRAARDTVEKYWSSAAPDRYALFTGDYKRDLSRIGIADATEYAKKTQDHERVWGARTYQKIDVSRDVRQKRDMAQVVVLVEWEQEGYKGVMTYIFDLVAEDSGWKISFIMH